MILLFAGQKGGSGKSTLATNCAAWLAQQKHDVVLVDADPQGSAAKWALYREENESLSIVHCVQKHERITKALQDLDKRYDFVVVDVPGRDSQEMRTAFLAAHIGVVPFRPSQHDLDTLPHIASVMSAALDLNPSLKCYAVLSMVPTNPVINEAEQAAAFINECPEFNSLLKSVVCDRKVYRDAVSKGKGVIEMSNPKAVSEIEALMREILK